ncbi:MAG: 16S rRNA (guanine(966)-N(2))-methyltransferase RsmD [Candidatus Omnitrophica bacterium]|nr:16S rRNA (guanine(966)-N(2))-methyltransferase RsmD [Candidatus Omnitrophota bacterium]
MLKITGGQFRGRTLVAPPTLRPTEAKVRQAVFNILGDFIDDARVLDGFAGSGAFGLEALSRGAAFVAFVESETEAVLCLRDNVARFDPELPPGSSRVVHMDIDGGLRMLAKEEPPFDVVILDPPYRAVDGKKALNTVVECAMLAPSGVVVLEHHRNTRMPLSVGAVRQWKEHRYGGTVLSLYQLGAAE